MHSRHFLVFLALVPNACAGPAQPTAREPEPQATAVPPASVVLPEARPSLAPAPTPPEHELALVLLQPKLANPPVVVEIKFPIFEQLISVAKAPAFKVRLKVENWPLAARGAGVEVALDKGAPRRVLDGDGIPLGSLSAKLEPGEHALTAWAVHDTGEIVRPPPGASRTPYAAVRFTIGESRSAKAGADVPVLRFVAPRGTINGDRAADTLLVDYLPLFIRVLPLPVRLKIQGDGAGAPPISAEIEARDWVPFGVRGLPNGDWKITLEQGALQATQVITVNRELAPALVP